MNGGNVNPSLTTPRTIDVQGHTQPMSVHGYKASCGNVSDGVSFQFGKQGGWVIALSELEAIVGEAHQARGHSPSQWAIEAAAKYIGAHVGQTAVTDNHGARDAWQLALGALEHLRGCISRAEGTEP